MKTHKYLVGILLLVLIPQSVMAATIVEVGIIGRGTPIDSGGSADPYRWDGGKVGIISPCQGVTFDGTKWNFVALGLGTSWDPYRDKDDAEKGLACVFEGSNQKIVIMNKAAGRWQMASPPSVLSVAPGSASARAAPPTVAAPAKSLPLFGTILHLGDSHAAGTYGLELGKQLASKSNAVVTYGCIGAKAGHYLRGELCVPGSQFLEKDKQPTRFENPLPIDDILLEYWPEFIIISLGTNYVDGNADYNDVSQLLQKIRNTKCYWVGAPVSTRSDIKPDEINAKLKALVEPTCTFINPVGFLSSSDVSSDDIHLNIPGGEKMAQNVFSAIFSEAFAAPSLGGPLPIDERTFPFSEGTLTSPSPISRKIDEVWSFKLAPALQKDSNVWDTRLSLPQWKPFAEVYPAPVAPLGIPGVALSPEVQKMQEIYRNYKQYIDAAATKYSIPVSLLVAVIFKESGGDPRAVSAGGAAGLMQMVLATFIKMGGKIAFVGVAIPDDLTAEGYRDFMNNGQHWGTCNGRSVSPCNSCQKEKCDFNNDQRFMPSIIIDLGAKHLSERIAAQRGNLELGLQEYNGGPSKAQYAREILRYKQMYEQEGAAACFPLKSNSLQRIAWNFGDKREKGARCHAGIDIFTQSPGEVVAVAPGTVKAVLPFYNCKDGWAAARTSHTVKQVLVYHPSLGKTVNYGEIDADAIDSHIVPGARVGQGQYIGRAGYCGMLHLELYDGIVASDVPSWEPPPREVVDEQNECAVRNYQKPQGLLDPTPLVRSLENKWCAPSVS